MGWWVEGVEVRGWAACRRHVPTVALHAARASSRVTCSEPCRVLPDVSRTPCRVTQPVPVASLEVPNGSSDMRAETVDVAEFYMGIIDVFQVVSSEQ